jgi:hypothetical protein
MMELKSEQALEELWEKCKTFLLKATEAGVQVLVG